VRKWIMPIPAAPDGGRAHPLAAATALFRQLHAEIRDALAGMDDAALHWVPCDGANSIATLVVHIVGSETETLSSIAGVAVARDRDAEFVEGALDHTALLALLDDADTLLNRVSATAPDIGRKMGLPTLPGETRPAMTWLIHNYGHAREHLGQLLLTKQLASQS